MKNLTKDQKNFLVVGIVSVIGVFVLLFFIRGLSDVKYSAPNTSEEKVERVEAAMHKVINMEFESRAFYSAASYAYPDNIIFKDIIEAQETYLSLLISTYETMGLTLPENNYLAEDVTLPKTIQAVCSKGVRIEEKQNKTYDKLDLDILGFIEVEASFYQFEKTAKEVAIPRLESCASTS